MVDVVVVTVVVDVVVVTVVVDVVVVKVVVDVVVVTVVRVTIEPELKIACGVSLEVTATW